MVMSRLVFFVSFIVSCSVFGVRATNAQLDEFDMSIEQLLDLTITTASGVEESLLEAPAAMVVITEQDFHRRGYLNLSDILSDLPSFDVIEGNASGHVTYYQRGYRVPWPTRTLLMVDGVVDNHLWTHGAMISRQYPISNIKRVEVLYGPASVIYGPNAFTGIINVITKDGKNLVDNEHVWQWHAEVGQWNSKGIELAGRGRFEELTYSISARQFTSDEEDLSGRWGFLSNDLYADEDKWGPLNDISVNGRTLDHYADPTNDSGVLAQFSYRDFKAGIIYWHINEGLGGNFAADRGHPNTQWQYNSRQYYLEHNWQPQQLENWQVKTHGLFRSSRVWGDWSEAEPDWSDGIGQYSHISHTQWNSDSKAVEVKQDYQYQLSEKMSLNGGWRIKKSDLTKAYDVPGYWDAYSSTTPATDTGPYGLGAAIYHSTDSIYDFESYPLTTMPDDNRQKSRDQGLYLSAVYHWQDWRFNLGHRHDNNSIWGSRNSPRLAAIYSFNQQKSTVKLVFGEAFQEGPGNLLYGGWNGRKANPDLKPEQTRNVEFILMHQQQDWLHDFSIYRTNYSHVIREDAINDGSREIWGLEYRGKFEYAHLNPNLANIHGYLYYSYTYPKTDRRYDHDSEIWVVGDEILGDISRHKINAGIYWPINHHWGVNLKGNFSYRTELYSRNAMKPQDHQVGSRFVTDITLKYNNNDWQLNFKIENLFNRKYLAPGLRKADAGNNFTERSLGYQNSLIPLPSRAWWISFDYQF